MMSSRLFILALSLLLYRPSALHAQATTTGEAGAPADTPPAAAQAPAPPADASAPAAATTSAPEPAAVSDSAAAAEAPPPTPAAAPDAAVAGASAAATQVGAPTPDARAARQAETERIQRELAEARAARPPVDQRQEPPPAAPPVDARARWTIAISADTLFMSDPGYAFFSEDDVSSRLGIWLGADLLDLGKLSVFAVEIGIGTERDRSDNVWDEDIDSELRSTTLQAGASLKFPVLSWLVPQVRLAAGASLLSMEVDTSHDEAFEDNAVSPFGALGAGVAIQTPARLFTNRTGNFASLSFGLLVEGGYGLRAPVKFQLKTETSGQPIPVTDADLGELALAGPYLRTSVILRF